jgi:hypothetical protein
MSIFEKKLARTSKAVLPTNPVDLFDRLFHQDGYGYLRRVQEEILKEDQVLIYV